MVPTLNEFGDVVLLENLDTSKSSFGKPFGGLEVGDVVMARSPAEPDNPDAYICKRIHALPGDPVPVDSRFERSDAHTDGAATPTAVVPTDTAWLLGDNELNSIDSRHYGPVPISLITSRVIFRIHPQDEAGPIEQRLPDELARLHEHRG